MTTSFRLSAFAAAALCALCLGAATPEPERPGDKGDTPEAKKLRGRTAAPTAAQIDSSVNLETMLKKDRSGLSQEKGATVEGYVLQVEKEEDGDAHLVLASSEKETDTKKWVIVEVTSASQKKPGMSFRDLEKLHGQKVRATGWLYWEPDEDQPDPRGTRWELHPVTEIAPAK